MNILLKEAIAKVQNLSELEKEKIGRIMMEEVVKNGQKIANLGAMIQEDCNINISSELTKNMLEDLKINNPVKIGVMASGSGSNFEVIAQSMAQGKLNVEIPIVIYNNPQAKVKQRCEKFNIKSILLNHRHFNSREDLDRSIVEVFQQNGVELIIMAGWMRIITPVLLNAFPQKIINIHPSLLPSFKGLNAVKQALDAGVKITGCTVHFASLEVDSGLIIMQSAVPVFPDDTEDSLHQRIQKQEHLIFPLAIAKILHQKEKEGMLGC